jgi:hypothetical protein
MFSCNPSTLFDDQGAIRSRQSRMSPQTPDPIAIGPGARDRHRRRTVRRANVSGLAAYRARRRACLPQVDQIALFLELF